MAPGSQSMVSTGVGKERERLRAASHASCGKGHGPERLEELNSLRIDGREGDRVRRHLRRTDGSGGAGVRCRGRREPEREPWWCSSPNHRRRPASRKAAASIARIARSVRETSVFIEIPPEGAAQTQPDNQESGGPEPIVPHGGGTVRARSARLRPGSGPELLGLAGGAQHLHDRGRHEIGRGLEERDGLARIRIP